MTESESKSDIREIIAGETIVEGKVYLNNFHCRLANPRYSAGSAGAYWATLAGRLDTPHVELHTKGFSDLMNRKTPREFYREVDEVARNTPGVDYAKILKMQADHFDLTMEMGAWSREMSKEEEKVYDRLLKKAIKSMDRLQKYVLPIYIELRMRGFSRLDLII
jgi:hypothetical protein